MIYIQTGAKNKKGEQLLTLKRDGVFKVSRIA